MKPSKIVGVDEAIEESQRLLGKWQEEAEDSREAASISLLRAVNPAWCHWLKESGTKSADIIHATVNLSTALICEVIGNVSDEKNHQLMGAAIAKLLQEKIAYGISQMDTAEPLPGFRRKDS